jgi:hypothetical protein
MRVKITELKRWFSTSMAPQHLVPIHQSQQKNAKQIERVLTSIEQLTQDQVAVERDLQGIKETVEGLRLSSTTSEAERSQERMNQIDEIITRLRTLPKDIEEYLHASIRTQNNAFFDINKRLTELETKGCAMGSRMSDLDRENPAPFSCTSPERPSSSPSPSTGALPGLDIEGISLETPEEVDDLQEEANWAPAVQDLSAQKRRRADSSEQAPVSGARSGENSHSLKKRRLCADSKAGSEGESEIEPEEDGDGSDANEREISTADLGNVEDNAAVSKTTGRKAKGAARVSESRNSPGETTAGNNVGTEGLERRESAEVSSRTAATAASRAAASSSSGVGGLESNASL